MPMKAETLAAINITEDQLIKSLIKDVQEVFTNIQGPSGMMRRSMW